jgi:hypothetical protein
MRPHSLAVKDGIQNPREKDFQFYVGDCQCASCGVRYKIFVNHAHYDLGRTFCSYLEELLTKDHKQNKTHQDIVSLPMKAELPRS